MKISSEKQLKRDLKYLKKHLDNDKEINQVIEHIEKVGIGSAEYFAKSLYSSLMEKHQNKLQDYTTHYTLTYLNLITTIGRETNYHKNRP